MTTQVLIRERPHRAIALATPSHILIFRHSPNSSSSAVQPANESTLSLQSENSNSGYTGGPRCIVELADIQKTDVQGYRQVSRKVYGTLGLITIDNDIFLCLVKAALRTAEVRPGETVMKIHDVAFFCLNKSNYDLDDTTTLVNGRPGVDGDPLDFERDASAHPCLALQKLLSGGTFYYSSDFDLTSRLQERSVDTSTFDFDSFAKGYLWNSYMIQPLMDFRSRLSAQERRVLDSTNILTSAIRGFALTQTIHARTKVAGQLARLSLISRLSCRRAGTRFNARGVDDDGNVANFVETETILWDPSGVCFSYVQCRGSVPLFWEQAAGLLPGQQKISITRSAQATQPAFDKHFEELEIKYGPVHIVNLLSKEKDSEIQLSERYRNHVKYSTLNSRQSEDPESENRMLRSTEYDFHAETRAPGRYEAASGIINHISQSAEGFGYCLIEAEDDPSLSDNSSQVAGRPVMIMQQQGIFRVNCLDCLDRTNLVQTIISKIAYDGFLDHRNELPASQDLNTKHGTLWADNGDALSQIYAGTGALKSSFTRSGKMSFAGTLADARKSATRLYINKFEDKGRQNTMDMLLGRLIGQNPVYLFDPINDFVASELTRRAGEYTLMNDISIWAGTLNLNGRLDGVTEDLSPWLWPSFSTASQNPHIFAVGFQEIVMLDARQMLSTDPTRRQAWEKAVKKTLNARVKGDTTEEYVLLRGGQLVGASLSVFVRRGILSHIKNVEGGVKKTGMSGMAGNKGAVAIRMDVDNTSLCFVTAHLAAGFANYEERNRDYKTISQGLRFQRGRSIDGHDTVIWLGDFNYRIGLADEKVRKLIDAEDWEKLYENDQLNLQMVAGLSFRFYSEARILFKPTYKFDLDTDNYDTSEKARIPAWCDRVLRKGNNIRQLSYSSALLRFSDHRPVYATFTCSISVVNEKRKEQLSQDIYRRRRVAVGESTANSKADETDDEDLIGYQSVAPGLPPASSETSRWWLDKGQSAMTKLKPPVEGMLPNPDRHPNPFIPSNKPDWITPGEYAYGRRDARGSGRLRGSDMSSPGSGSLRSSPMASPHGMTLRALPPPLLPRRTDSISSTTSSLMSNDQAPSLPKRPPGSVIRTPSITSVASTTSSHQSSAAVPRKPRPPPVPRKPAVLSAQVTPATSKPGSSAAANEVMTVGLLPQRASTYPVKPTLSSTSEMRLRAGTMPTSPSSRIMSPPQNLLDDDFESVASDGPVLPVRGVRSIGVRSSGSTGGLDALRSWKPLTPDR